MKQAADTARDRDRPTSAGPMRALRLEEAAPHLATNHPRPQPGSNEALIRTRKAAVSAVDLELCRGLFDFTGTYMELPPLPRQERDYPYEKLAEHARSSRKLHRNDEVPYLPYVGAGFNAKPWPDDRARFAFPTKEEWTRELRQVKADLDRIENLGLPLPDGRRQKALVIYAWNEFGEGGIVAPTQGEGYMKLEAIKEVFSSPNPQRAQ